LRPAVPRELTYREAAKRVGRTMRAIRYWRQDGMPMGWAIRNGQDVRVVDEAVLLKEWRRRLKNDPAHQYRLRRLREAQMRAQDATRRNPDAPSG
jgi:hypothetical protein